MCQADAALTNYEILNQNLKQQLHNMKKMSVPSSSLCQQSDEKEPSQLGCSEKCSLLLSQILHDIQVLKKDLKQKVSRCEFVSNLSTKVSLSELGSMGFPEKENTGSNTNTQERYHKIEHQLRLLETQVRHNKLHGSSGRTEEIKMNEEVMRRVQEEHAQSINKLELKLQSFQEQQQQRLAELEAYAFRKADRSQIEKLFSLNELLVIEIEQAKQKSEEHHKKTILQVEGLVSQPEACMKREEVQDRRWQDQFRGLEARLNDLVMQKSTEIDRILDILETKQANREQDQQIYGSDLESLCSRLKILQVEQKLAMRELETRVSVLQLKQSQINRALREVDRIKIQTEALQRQLGSVCSKSREQSEIARQFCQSAISATRRQISSNFESNIQIANEEIMKKVVSLTEQLIRFEEVNDMVSPLKEKYRQLHQLQIEVSQKIQYLDKKQILMEETVDQEIEKNEERISLLRRQIENCINQKQLQDLLSRFVKLDELKDIGRQIEKKVDQEIAKVVAEQNKINQVICSENIMAKWIWNSGTLKGGNLVGWDRQIVNTLPENFSWAKGDPLVKIGRGGYYRVEMGFYSKKKPTVQLIVNGQTIVSAVSSSSYVLHHSSGKLKDVSSSQIAGLAFVNYFLLPDEARIAISYNGQLSGEGFFAIHRI